MNINEPVIDDQQHQQRIEFAELGERVCECAGIVSARFCRETILCLLSHSLSLSHSFSLP